MTRRLRLRLSLIQLLAFFPSAIAALTKDSKSGARPSGSFPTRKPAGFAFAIAPDGAICPVVVERPFRLDPTRQSTGSLEMATWVKCTDKTGVCYVNFDRVEYVRRDLQSSGSCLFLSGHRDECMVVNEPPEELIRLPDSFRR